MIGRTPIYRVYRGDKDVTDRFQDRVLKITIVSKERNGEADKFEIEIDDRDFKLDIPFQGDNITILLGYAETGLWNMGKFEMSRVEHSGPPAKLLLEGESIGFSGIARAPKINDFQNKTIGEVVRRALKDVNVDVFVHESFENETLGHLSQVTSALHFLSDLARRNNAVIKYTDGWALFIPRDNNFSIVDGKLGIAPMLYVPKSEISTWQVVIDDRPQFSEVQVAYWDEEAKMREFVSANVFADRARYSVDLNETFVIDVLYASKEEAQRAAQSRADALARMSRRLSLGLAKGEPGLRGGTVFIVDGLRDVVNGDWITDEVTHTYTKDEGLTTSIEAHISTVASFRDRVRGDLYKWITTPPSEETMRSLGLWEEAPRDAIPRPPDDGRFDLFGDRDTPPASPSSSPLDETIIPNPDDPNTPSTPLS